MFKFGWLPNGKTDQEFLHPNTFALEQTSGPQRIVIAPSSGQVALLEQLIQPLADPFHLLNILVISRSRIAQKQISELEKRTDMHISTLRRSIEAMGGKLSIIAEFPDHAAILLKGLAELTP